MDKLEMQGWFGTLSESEKMFVLRDIIDQLAIALKVIYVKGDAEQSLRASCSVSEINDLFARKLRATLAMEATCPDDVVIDILLRTSCGPS